MIILKMFWLLPGVFIWGPQGRSHLCCSERWGSVRSPARGVAGQRGWRPLAALRAFSAHVRLRASHSASCPSVLLTSSQRPRA